MPARTTDNFLPRARSQSSYRPRPVMRPPRRDYTQPGMRIIEDIAHASPPPLQTPRVQPGVIQMQPPRKARIGLRQKRLKYMLIVAVCMLTGIVGVMGINAGHNPRKPVQALQSLPEKPKAPAKQAAVTFGVPVRMSIPKISVTAAVDPMGTTPSGDMDTPKVPENTGWFSAGPRPGEVGSAVIDGHFGWKNDLPAVFDNLHLLQKGDVVTIEDDKGAITTFIVRELRTYGRDDDATDVFRSNDGKAHLNLITCQGAWNERQKSYSTRLVVFTDKVQ